MHILRVWLRSGAVEPDEGVCIAALCESHYGAPKHKKLGTEYLEPEAVASQCH